LVEARERCEGEVNGADAGEEGEGREGPLESLRDSRLRRSIVWAWATGQLPSSLRANGGRRSALGCTNETGQGAWPRR
jgi:hypothetical protein